MNAKNSLNQIHSLDLSCHICGLDRVRLFPQTGNGISLPRFRPLPVLMDGSFQPLDSVARNSLLQIRTKQTVLLDDGRAASATEWLLTTLANPEVADGWKIFRVDNSEVLALLKLPENQVYFSYNQLKPGNR
jgi:hypothetical protein